MNNLPADKKKSGGQSRIAKSKIHAQKTKNQKPKIVFAKKSFGQNFLVDENYIDKIISALDPQTGEIIIEIGAGRGALTAKLIASGANVVAVELERQMLAVLKQEFGEFESFKLVESDALQVDFKRIIENESNPQIRKAKLVANLPYNISTAILQKLIEQRSVFSEMILMFQLEVVERITAKVGNSERGYLTVLTEAYLETEKLFEVPPSAFKPAPKVKSAVVRLITRKVEDLDLFDEQLFREIISFAFRQKRKTILNNLRNLPPESHLTIDDLEGTLSDCQINPNRRAETLSLDEWKKLTQSISKSTIAGS